LTVIQQSLSIDRARLGGMGDAVDDFKQTALGPPAAHAGLPRAAESGPQFAAPAGAAPTAVLPDVAEYRGYVLAILVVVYTFNFIDRQILGILAVPIKTELGLSDRALGMLGGLAFALFYTLLGIPIARLADRVGRVGIIAVAVGLWSFATAACGAAHSFAQLFWARLAVGVGEAGGVAPAYSLICDYFPSRQRARALAVYSFGIPIGSALGIVLGGFITHWMSWRMAFVIVGGVGFWTAPILKLTVREPPRGVPAPAPDSPARSNAKRNLSAVLATLASKPSFWGLALGGGTCSMMGYGLFFWMPSFLVRSFGLSVLQASLFYGGLVLVAGTAGIWAGGVLADRLGQRSRSAYAWVPAVAFLCTVPFYAVGILSTNLAVCLLLLGIPTALALAWLGPVLAAVQHLVLPAERSTASAVFLFVNNLLGLGVGTMLIGVISDVLHVRGGVGVESLRYAILAGLSCYLIAAALFMWGARHLEGDWVEDPG
jgi:MFS family permease